MKWGLQGSQRILVLAMRSYALFTKSMWLTLNIIVVGGSRLGSHIIQLVRHSQLRRRLRAILRQRTAIRLQHIEHNMDHLCADLPGHRQ